MTPGCTGYQRGKVTTKRFRFCGCPCGYYWDEINDPEKDPECPECGNKKGELSTIIDWDDGKDHLKIKTKEVKNEETHNLS